MNRGNISAALRSLRLIYLADYIRSYLERFKNRNINREFKRTHPDVHLPPDYIIYESFRLRYDKYYDESLGTTKWLITCLQKDIELKNKSILDWGCGAGRILRHLPALVGNECKYYGTDYNEKSIVWCTANLPGIEFNHNSMEPQLPYADNSMDVIYGLSVLTHLSETMHYGWYKELNRVLKQGGIMLFTTQGNHFRTILTEKEKSYYDKGQLVVRGKVKEGHRTFSTFHPDKFMKSFFKDSEIVEHLVLDWKKGKLPPQDTWIIKKK